MVALASPPFFSGKRRRSFELEGILGLGRCYWPQTRFFDKQEDMVESVAQNVETVVVAGNELGKDYTAGFICVTFFLCPQLYFPVSYVQAVEDERLRLQRELGREVHELEVHTRRIITTSVKERHLGVLWAEIGKRLVTSEVPLLESRGGPLILNSFGIRFAREAEAKLPMSYLVGQVAESEEAMAGHHAAYTLFVADEASGIDDAYYRQAQGWAKRFLIFGNPNKCSNFFFNNVEAGDLE